MKINLNFLREGFVPSRFYKWELRFTKISESLVEIPDKYSDWFPATEVDLSLYEYNEGTIQAGSATTSFSSGYSLGTVSFSFINDENDDLVNFLLQQEKLKRENRPLIEYCVALHIIKYKGGNSISSSYNLICYLSSSLKRNLRSESGVEIIPVEYKIVGFLEKES